MVLHTFVVLAYKESIYLETCIKSVLNQKYKSDVVIATSTPNDFIYNFFFYLKVSFIYKKQRKYFKSFCLLIKAISNIKYAKLKIVF